MQSLLLFLIYSAVSLVISDYILDKFPKRNNWYLVLITGVLVVVMYWIF